MKHLPLISITLAVVWFFSVHVEAQAVVIANPSVKSDEITKNELRDVFTGETKNLKDGSHVVPVLLQQGPTHTEFLADYVHVPDTMLRQDWRRLMFAGQAIQPKTFDDEAAVVAYVAHTPGAIGYIGKGTAHEGVKVLIVK
jgi:ABC-type phosphate transport system substrate-binding protein